MSEEQREMDRRIASISFMKEPPTREDVEALCNAWAERDYARDALEKARADLESAEKMLRSMEALLEQRRREASELELKCGVARGE